MKIYVDKTVKIEKFEFSTARTLGSAQNGGATVDHALHIDQSRNTNESLARCCLELGGWMGGWVVFSVLLSFCSLERSQQKMWIILLNFRSFVIRVSITFDKAKKRD
jgi:hypothetical protein